MTIVFKEESYQIMGACFAVYSEMGCGFLESVYQECLELELFRRGIHFESRPQLGLTYKEQRLIQKYVPDLICFGKIVVELKAARQLSDEHRAQIHNYVRAADFKLGLLVNFGHHPKVEHERIVC